MFALDYIVSTEIKPGYCLSPVLPDNNIFEVDNGASGKKYGWMRSSQGNLVHSIFHIG